MDISLIYMILAILSLALSEIAPFIKSTEANGIVHGLAQLLGVIAKTGAPQIPIVVTLADTADQVLAQENTPLKKSDGKVYLQPPNILNANVK